MAVSYLNPSGGGKQTSTLNVVNEFDSFTATSFYAGQSPTELPVEFKILPDGMGYIKIDTFSDNEVLMIQLWERAISTLNANKVPGVIIDMRQNRGGDGWLAQQMAAYFFDKDTFYGTSSLYNSPGNDSTMIPPRSDLQYGGKVVVMVGPGCVSACEFFSRGMTIDNRATIVGQYPSAGGGGSVDQFVMPMGLFVEMPIGKTVDKDGNIVIEGVGIVPTVKVPVTVSTVLFRREGRGRRAQCGREGDRERNLRGRLRRLIRETRPGCPSGRVLSIRRFVAFRSRRLKGQAPRLMCGPSGGHSCELFLDVPGRLVAHIRQLAERLAQPIRRRRAPWRTGRAPFGWPASRHR